MMIWRVEKAVPAHIPAIAAGMREADVREVWASDRWLPDEALEKSLLASVQAWTCLLDRSALATDAPAGNPPTRSLVTLSGLQPASADSFKGKPAFMWGVCRGVAPDTGVPWLLSTDDIYTVSREFLKQSRAYVERMQAHFLYLENRVHAENIFSMRWLKWCGFTVNDTPEMINGESFYSFWRERNA